MVGIFGPTANGDRFTLFQILLATVASTMIVLLLIALTYYRLPWRQAARTRHPEATAHADAEPAPAQTPRPPARASEARRLR